MRLDSTKLSSSWIFTIDWHEDHLMHTLAIYIVFNSNVFLTIFSDFSSRRRFSIF